MFVIVINVVSKTIKNYTTFLFVLIVYTKSLHGDTQDKCWKICAQAFEALPSQRPRAISLGKSIFVQRRIRPEKLKRWHCRRQPLANANVRSKSNLSTKNNCRKV